MSGRPLDVLEASLEESVTVNLKDGSSYYGTLAGYDQHMNVVLEAPADEEEAILGEIEVTPVEDTTIIRGDNVVTIKA
ncbi:Like-Sm ribonucleoprotein core [Halogeometricum borinquense]|uniref:Small Nuclear ribonucleoprotein, LSM family n=2 Tax=Halogeometricum borinquense TaxID=60847 RepID=E4NR43_HALBP|nr:LSM domain-containing protein [Halogeometricum borinquense]ADQ66779.1 Small nuclear ribonucleoprotein, LSM family [Halogeometricum borinquense DSM 11551]ELY30287.1 small nuclear ribonucleoprotein, lsm family [Halogeometricum borinquense DSM 11551]QIB74903.1 Like-Sm ribonucleoprotein core [Halogeometricum borinquense]QIQ76097.1 Like-Sm ribonucleoprotein core [Halogeometricum borinquense]RYJ14249.1 Like-Sm ribonucleoprotein core [Halogeometricum borinquense]